MDSHPLSLLEKTRQPYNPELYLSALLQRDSPYASPVNNSNKKKN
jgi:hypothetical protein